MNLPHVWAFLRSLHAARRARKSWVAGWSSPSSTSLVLIVSRTIGRKPGNSALVTVSGVLVFIVSASLVWLRCCGVFSQLIMMMRSAPSVVRNTISAPSLVSVSILS